MSLTEVTNLIDDDEGDDDGGINKSEAEEEELLCWLFTHFVIKNDEEKVRQLQLRWRWATISVVEIFPLYYQLGIKIQKQKETI